MPLRSLPRLTRITIDRNPLTTRTDANFSMPRLVALLPALQRVNGARVTGEVRAKAAAYQKGWVEAIVATYQRKVFDDHMSACTAATAMPLGAFLPGFLAAREHGLYALDPLARRGAAALRKRGDEPHVYASLALASREKHLRQAYAAGTLPVARDDRDQSSCGCLLAGPQLLQTCLRLDSIINHELQQSVSESAPRSSHDHHTPRSRSSQSLPATPLRMAAPLPSSHSGSVDASLASSMSMAPFAMPPPLSRAANARSLHRRLNSAQLDDYEGEDGTRLRTRVSRQALLRDPAIELAIISPQESVAT